MILNTDRSGTANVTVSLFDVDGALAFTDSFKIQEDGAKLVAIPKTLGKDFLANARIVADRRVQALVFDRSKVGGSTDAYEVQGGAATCTWNIPAGAKGKAFRGSVTVSFEGLRASQSYTGKVR